MNKKNKFAILILFLFIITTQASAERTNENGRTRIIVGGEVAYPPYSYIDDNGEPAGFSIDLTREIAKVMGLDIEIKLMTWENVLKGIDDGSIDIIPGMFYSDERSKKYRFSTPFSIVSSSIFARKNSPSAESLEDVRNKEIIIMRGEAMHEYVINNKISERLILTETIEDALRMLASGKGDYALIARTPGLYWIKELKLTNLIPVGKSIEPFKNCFSAKKDNTLLISKFNEGLSILHQTGVYEELYDKWLGVLEVQHITIRLLLKYSVIIAIPLIIFLALAILWSSILKKQVKKATEDIRKSETDLRNSEARLRTLIQTIPDLIWLKDKDGVYLTCNTMFERFFGAKEKDITGKTDYDFVDRELADFFREKDREAIEAGVPSINEEWITFADDGHRAMLETIKTPMYDDRGNLIGVLGIGRDITERKQSEERISALLAEKQILLQEVHHRIKNNMNTIRGLLSLQHAEEKNPSAAASLRDAEMRVNSMIILFDKLYVDENYRELSVKNYLDSLIRDIVYSSPEREIVSIETEIEDRILNVNILTPLGIIINELITNATKYAFTGRENGLISISASFPGGSGRITVRDNGVGIPDSVHTGGTSGFGLNLVRMIVEQLNGKLRIEKNGGTVIIVDFEVSP